MESNTVVPPDIRAARALVRGMVVSSHMVYPELNQIGLTGMAAFYLAMLGYDSAEKAGAGQGVLFLQALFADLSRNIPGLQISVTKREE